MLIVEFNVVEGRTYFLNACARNIRFAFNLDMDVVILRPGETYRIEGQVIRDNIVSDCDIRMTGDIVRANTRVTHGDHDYVNTIYETPVRRTRIQPRQYTTTTGTVGVQSLNIQEPYPGQVIHTIGIAGQNLANQRAVNNYYVEQMEALSYASGYEENEPTSDFGRFIRDVEKREYA